MSLAELAGKIAVVAVPAGIGAALARSQLGERDEEGSPSPGRRFAGELFLMAAGAVFFAFNLAPTDEIPLIAHQQRSPWVAIALVALSLLTLHGFVYGVGFRGQHGPRRGRRLRADLLGLTLPRLCHRARGLRLCALDLRPARRPRTRSDAACRPRTRPAGVHRRRRCRLIL